MTTNVTKLKDIVQETRDGSVALPAAGTSVSVRLEPGAYTQFLFKMNQIESVALSPAGALAMKMANGSTMVIENFQALANSAESCGRDTIFQMLKDVPGGANGAGGLQIVNIAPDALLRALDPALAADKTIQVSAPEAGMTREVVMEPGQTYKFNFDWDGAAKTVDGTNLMLSFKNGGLVILRDFVPVTSGDLPPALTLADGSAVDANHLIASVCTPTGETAMRAPDIEPAAGDPASQRAAAAPVELAQALANIEPAAGGANAPAIGGRGGAGFSSGIDPAGINGLSPLGPIGPTALAYGIPRVDDAPVSGTPVADDPVLPPPVTPPPVPSLTVRDECVYEDGSIGLTVQTRGPAETTTVLSISGFPAGWSVDPGLGSFNAATRVWSITVPAGADFSGGPIIHPPHDADRDISALSVTATATSGLTGLSSTATGAIKVVTDAVADAPNLNVGTSASGEQDTAIPLTVTSSLNDTDGSEVLSIRITGLPAGAVLSAGALQQDGSYLLTPAQLTNLNVTPAAGYVGTFTLNVTATATETNLSGEECDLTNNVATTARTITVTVGADDVPIIVNAQNSVDETNLGPINVNGTLNVNYGSDAPGTTAPTAASSFTSGGSLLGGHLTSNGVPVVVTLEGDTYMGKAGSTTVFTLQVGTNGTYAFRLLDNLDHADGNNPDDVITLGFGVRAVDSDGDPATGTITISVRDDAPIANDDTPALVGGIATGNVTANDDPGEDNPGTVISVIVNGTTHTVPATGTTTIAGLYGTLVIAATGAYTYTATSGANGTDSFTYSLRDRDGDIDTAVLRVTTADGRPTIGDGAHTIDETNLGPINVNGMLVHNYGSDGPGSIHAEGVGSFTSGGSRLNNTLTSGGVPVTVTLQGDTYIGNAGATTVFTLQVNSDGTYAFRLLDNLDHADRLNPNDIITLNFGVKITDQDNDADTGVITINVLDDAPVPLPDQKVANECVMVTGNVLANDHSVENPYVSFVTFGGQTHTVSPTGQTTVVGAYGTLTIERDGDYTYTPKCEVVTTTMSPDCNDVIDSESNPTITKNGITISAIDPTTGHLTTDLSWVFDDFNIGNTGIGINGDCVNGPREALRISYGSEPADALWITVGNWSVPEQAAGVLMARVYLAGSDTPTTIALTSGVPGPYPGIMSYKIDAEARFNNVPIDHVELYLNDPGNHYSFTLINVSVERYTEGVDQFGYTVTDYDGDAATSTLSINTDNDNLGRVLAAAVQIDDPVSLAIHDFVAGGADLTTGRVSGAAIDLRGSFAATDPIMDPVDQIIQQQAA